jgi:hypothetical protein
LLGVSAHRAAPAVISALLIAALLSACGGSSGGGGNGLASKSADQIIKATTRASESAKSVHVSGSLNQGGTKIALDLKMVAGVGATGSMSDGGKHFSLVLDHGTLYINGGPSFWRAFGNASVTSRLQGKWLKTPATGNYASIAKFADLHQFFQQIFNETKGKVAKTSTKTINGTKVIGVRDTTKTGTLYIATSGKAYPVEIDGATSSKSGATGKLDFTGFNSAVTITAPKKSISVSQLQQQAG